MKRKHPQLGTPGSGLYVTPSQKHETWNLEENQGPPQPRRGSPGSGAGSGRGSTHRARRGAWPRRGVRVCPATSRHPRVTAEREQRAGVAVRTPHHEGQCCGLEVTLLTLLQIRLQVANNGQSVPDSKVITITDSQQSRRDLFCQGSKAPGGRRRQTCQGQQRVTG